MVQNVKKGGNFSLVIKNFKEKVVEQSNWKNVYKKGIFLTNKIRELQQFYITYYIYIYLDSKECMNLSL